MERRTEYIYPTRPVACIRMGVAQCDPQTNGDLWECQQYTTLLLDKCASQVDVLLWWFDTIEAPEPSAIEQLKYKR